jgi:hypothetical protein
MVRVARDARPEVELSRRLATGRRPVKQRAQRAPRSQRRNASSAAHSAHPACPWWQMSPCVGGLPTQQSTPPRASTRPELAEPGKWGARGAGGLLWTPDGAGSARSRFAARSAFARSPGAADGSAASRSSKATLAAFTAPPGRQRRASKACGRCVQRPPRSHGSLLRTLSRPDLLDYMVGVVLL